MGKTIRETMQEFTVNQALKYLEGNPSRPDDSVQLKLHGMLGGRIRTSV